MVEVRPTALSITLLEPGADPKEHKDVLKRYGITKLNKAINERLLLEGILELEDGALITGPQTLFEAFTCTSDSGGHGKYWYSINCLKDTSEKTIEHMISAKDEPRIDIAEIMPFVKLVKTKPAMGAFQNKIAILDYEAAANALIPQKNRNLAIELYNRARQVGEQPFKALKSKIETHFDEVGVGIINLFDIGLEGKTSTAVDDAARSVAVERHLCYVGFGLTLQGLMPYAQFPMLYDPAAPRVKQFIEGCKVLDAYFDSLPKRPKEISKAPEFVRGILMYAVSKITEVLDQIDSKRSEENESKLAQVGAQILQAYHLLGESILGIPRTYGSHLACELADSQGVKMIYLWDYESGPAFSAKLHKELEDGGPVGPKVMEALMYGNPVGIGDGTIVVTSERKPNNIILIPQEKKPKGN